MQEKGFSLIALSLLSLLLVFWVQSPRPVEASPGILTVPDPYPTIQQAIDAASPGDIIQVAPGTYYEHLTVDKKLTLVGENRTTTIIDGKGTDNVVYIIANGVNITGFTIRNRAKHYNGIKASGHSGVIVTNNIVSSNVHGINILNSLNNIITGNTFFENSICGISLAYSGGNTIADNNISESAYGIELYASNTTYATGNTVSNNSYGIYLNYSSDITVSNNTALHNSYGILAAYSDNIIVDNNIASGSTYGIELYGSISSSVVDNVVSDNPSYAIYLVDSNGNSVGGNTVSRNDWGISLHNSTGNTIIENQVSDNTFGICPVSYSTDNFIYHNNFMDNIEQVKRDPTSPNDFNTPTPPYQGNYWSDYEGEDLNSDGIGDTLIPHLAVDFYPLMAPWGIFHDVAIVNVTLSSTKAYVGEMVNITVVAGNQGTETETFNVTAKYENTTYGIFETIGIQEVIELAPDVNITLTFDWNTTYVQPCINYTIKVEASVVPGEFDTADNTYIGGTVKVKILGDVNGDGVINIFDLTRVALAYGSEEGEPEYDPEADINRDGIVDIGDVSIIGKNYGKTC